MKKLILCILLFLSVNLYPQEADTSKKGPWFLTSVAGLNANQVSLSNWTQGGDNSIAWTLFGKLSVNFAKDNWQLKNNLKVAYGQTKLGSADFRTNDNEMYLEDVLSYDASWTVNPFFSNSLRTVLVKGFDYSKTPEVQIANFFDPGYLTQSLGFGYNLEKVFLSRLGIALQEIFTNKFTSYSDDPDTKDKAEKFKLETGIESVTEGNLGIAENMNFNSKLRLFSRFKTIDVWDVRWDNTLTAKINKFFNVNLNVLVIYQKDQSTKTQMKQSLQMGVTYTLF
jgi:hypothetical protein